MTYDEQTRDRVLRFVPPQQRRPEATEAPDPDLSSSDPATAHAARVRDWARRNKAQQR